MKAISTRTRSQKKSRSKGVSSKEYINWKAKVARTGSAKWKAIDDWIERQSLRRGDDDLEDFIAPEDDRKQSAEDVWRKTRTKVTSVRKVAPVQVVDVRQMDILQIKLLLRKFYKPSQIEHLPYKELEQLLVATNPKKYKVSAKPRKNIDEYNQTIKLMKTQINKKQRKDFINKKQPSPKRKPLSPKPSPPTLKRTLSGNSLPGIRLKRTLSGDSLPGIKLKRSPKITPRLLRIYERDNAMMDWFERRSK